MTMPPKAVSNLPSEFARSSHWGLEELSIRDGVVLTISFDPNAFCDEEDDLTQPIADTIEATYAIRFEEVAEWTFVDMVYMWQYFPIDDSPPVLVEIEQDDPRVYVEEFSINSEAFPLQWRRFRVIAGDEVIEVLTAKHPVVEEL